MAYDDKEARWLLGQWIDQSGLTEDERGIAAEELVNAVEKLNKDLGSRAFIQKRDGYSFKIASTGMNPNVAAVTYEPIEMQWVITKYHSREVIGSVKLDFDPATRQFVSREREDFTAPEPGKPYPRRSALAEIVSAAINAVS